MIVIGLAGYARSGKDTFADAIVEIDKTFRKVSFADVLRRSLSVLDPIVGINSGRAVHWGEAMEGGYDDAKRGPYAAEIRRLQQRMGTDVGRNILDENLWVKAMATQLTEHSRWVIPDVRFPNEVRAIAAKEGGQVRRITRKGTGPVNDHPSEVALDWMNIPCIHNDGTVEDLRDQAALLVARAVSIEQP